MKTRTMILLIALFLPVSAQQQRGTITGRVVTDEGTPLSGVTVMLASYNGSAISSTLKRALTDQEGNFQFTNLAAHSYTINVTETLGYVAPSYPPNVPRPVYRIGENVTLRLTRGGVITGRVTYASGDPIIGVYVSAIRIRDANGAPVNIQSPFLARLTDDRGVYRVYGVSAGTYIVAVNHGGATFYGQQTPFDGDAPTYYPSATRDTAVEIQVQTGIESSGIDIRHRSERGFAVSGKIIGGESTGPMSFTASAVIRTFPTGLNAGIAIAESGTGGFSFLGLPDGEYELVAEMGSSDSDGNQLSEPRRVTVRGSDVTGIELRLMPMASIAGKVLLEPSPNVCDPKAKPSLEELTLISRREEKPTDSPALLQRYQVVLAPNDKGEFKLNRLAAGRYRIETNLPSDNWFVKAISSGASAAGVRTSTAATRPANTTDLAKLGALLKPGDRLTGVTVTIADGAASLRGKIAPAKDGGKLPSRLRVFLVPAEATATDDVLRYGEALTSDGSFVFTNFAPGKYWLLAKPVADAEPTDRMPSPVAWDAAERLKLRKAAEAAKTEIELKPCQRVKDHVLKF
ncbi:MAG: carboxypeptidase-like regulatory domain-containing protein [Acidobacteriota bacterium]|nr:carboxypeptidase-like regulatory domain-containing protein [Acidobacteriota bacterium]